MNAASDDVGGIIEMSEAEAREFMRCATDLGPVIRPAYARRLEPWMDGALKRTYMLEMG